jgi:hypothetical protein
LKFFVHDNERESTAYHEFYKGKWDGKTFWSKDSICLHDDTLVEHDGFYKALLEMVPGYDPYAIPVEVSKETWGKVRAAIPTDDMESIEIYNEADTWAKEAFDKDGCFTILGI